MTGSRGVPQLLEPTEDVGFRVQEQLIGIGSTVCAHSEGFAAPKQLGATAAESSPSTQGVGGWRAGRGGIPTLHRVNRKPVGQFFAGDGDRLPERSVGATEDFVAIECGVGGAQLFAEARVGLELRGGLESHGLVAAGT